LLRTADAKEMVLARIHATAVQRRIGEDLPLLLLRREVYEEIILGYAGVESEGGR